MRFNPDGSYVIYILSPEHCEKVQKRLFELGLSWSAGGPRVQYTDSHRLFIGYHNTTWDRRRLSYCREHDWVHREELMPLTLEDLYDQPDEKMEPAMPSAPTKYHKWHSQCFAGHILKHHSPSGTMKGALTLIQRGGYIGYTEKELWGYALKSRHERPDDFPEELLIELQHRRDA